MLATAQREAQQLDGLPADLLPANIEEGYAINGLVAQRLGWKIAGTTPAMREKRRVTDPIYGRTY
jgi:2-keto-4-pentenoate hydratase